MSKFYRCPKCGRPAKAVLEAESFAGDMVGKLRKYYCHFCKYAFWREPGGLG